MSDCLDMNMVLDMDTALLENTLLNHKNSINYINPGVHCSMQGHLSTIISLS